MVVSPLVLRGNSRVCFRSRGSLRKRAERSCRAFVKPVTRGAPDAASAHTRVTRCTSWLQIATKAEQMQGVSFETIPPACGAHGRTVPRHATNDYCLLA